jgi:aspartyl-tRNA synthetase
VDELVEKAKSQGAKACYTAKVTGEGVQSGLEKTLGAETLKQMAAAVGAKPGDLIVAIAAKDASLLDKGIDNAAAVAGQVRLYLGDKLGLIDRRRWEFLWLTGFPLFEWAEKEGAWVPAQHPFTGVVEEDLDLLEQPARRGEIRSLGYDLVLNGIELGSGSVRIHRQDIQARVFKALGLTDEQARQRFGFFLDALTYGTPPHGGIALGLDRVAMLIAGETSIREVIAFPKTAQAADLMADAPKDVSLIQLWQELRLLPLHACEIVCETKGCESINHIQQGENSTTPGVHPTRPVRCLFCGNILSLGPGRPFNSPAPFEIVSRKPGAGEERFGRG